jgi:SAM-dependent methyltransferase
MQYDPIKHSLGKIFNQTTWLRIFFYRLLNLLLLRSWYIKKELKKWVKNAPASVSILDAGSGFGQYVWQLSRLSENMQITGFDIKQEQIEDCNKFFSKIKLSDRIIFKQADITQIDDRDQYNLVILIDVLEHIEDDEKVLQNIWKSLKNDSILIISTPSDSVDMDHDSEHKGFIDEHVRDGYNKQDLEEKLIRAGFNNIELRYTYGKYGNIAWKLSMKYPILILNKSKLFFILLLFYYIVTFPFACLFNYMDTKTNNTTGTGLLAVAQKIRIKE